MTDLDATIAVPNHRVRSQAPTVRSSNHSGRGRSPPPSASVSDEEDEEDRRHIDSPTDSLGYSDQYSDEESWPHDKADVGPSESASSASNNQHLAPAPTRRRSHREPSSRLVRRTTHPRRGHQPPSPDSLGSHEEYVLDPRQRAYYAPPGGRGYHYAGSYTSAGYGNYAPSGQVVPYQGSTPPYPYAQYQIGGHQPAYPFPQPGMPPMPQPHNPYEVMPAPAHSYYPQYPPQHYHVPHGGAAVAPPPAPVYQYQHIYSHTPARQESPAQPPADPAGAKESEGYAELKQMLIKEREEREEREAKAKKEREDALKKAEEEKKHAEEIAAAAAKAAADATTEAEKKAADKAAEEAKKAEEDAARAKAEADAALAMALLPPEEKRKPIKFKDAVGRKFSFPFHLCCTWEGMEDLIRQAFLHVDVIGPHVAEGHYDLIGPNNEIILPGVWETVIEPDWTVTMHMWPMPEPKAEEVVEVPEKKDEKKDKAKGKTKPAKKKAEKAAKPAPAASGEVPPPPPPPPVPPGAAEAVPAKKKKPAGGFSLFGAPKPKPKPKAAAAEKKK